MTELSVCSEPGCTAPADLRCGGSDNPTGAGCGEPYCGDHLFVTSLDGDLCNADYNNIDDLVAGEVA